VCALAKHLLTFTRSNKQPVPETAAVSDLVGAALSLLRSVLNHDQVMLELDIPRDLPRVFCVPTAIEQVLLNLVGNARDALNERYHGRDPDKVIIITARVLPSDANNNRPQIRITVEDHGTGISPEVANRLFEPFFTTKPNGQGTGLGLAICHSIVRDNNGQLTVESQYGMYTRFYLDLPQAEPES